jgi:hypothetical protein
MTATTTNITFMKNPIAFPRKIASRALEASALRANLRRYPQRFRTRKVLALLVYLVVAKRWHGGTGGATPRGR